MARIASKAAAAIALLAISMHYAGLTPSILGVLQTLFPRLSSSPGPTINAPKLLADLNSDILSTTTTDSSSWGPRSKSNKRRMDFLPAALVALSRLVAGDRQLQDWMLGATEGGGGGGGGGGISGGGGRRDRKQMPRGKLLSRLGEVLKSGVPLWQAAASVLLHSLSMVERGSDSPSQQEQHHHQQQHAPHLYRNLPQHHPLVLEWVSERVDVLAHVGKTLVEAGAHFNSSDAVQSGAQLLQVVTGLPAGRKMVLELEVPVLLAQPPTYLPTCPHGASLCPPARGLVAPLVREVRQGQAASLGSSLELLMELITLSEQEGGGSGGGGGGGSGTGDSGGDGDGNGNNAVAREVVGAGALSLCVQLLFQGDSDARAHSACCNLVRYTASHRKLPPAPGSGGGSGGVWATNDGGDEDDHDGGDVDAAADDDDDDDKGDAGHQGPYAAGRGAGGRRGGGGVLLCERSEAGRGSLARELLRVMRETDFADLHNSVLEACRDVAPSRTAALALVEAGIIRHLAIVLAHNTTKSREEGSHDASTIAWILQSQRSAGALVGLLALQPELRERLVVEGALGALVVALRVHSGRPGLMAQVRVTAAAALVPLLGEESRYHRLAVAAGVLEPLLEMYARGGGAGGSRGGGGGAASHEAQVARRVMTLLAREELVAEMFKNLGIDL
ncbi:hypothetical protein VOLCADRAFT_89395 [Volvox carteri f. nagariensis]|uniref:Uncharacterized protein n=1 Tax=Volvox carteri f. nagariensis TaxID=3068 RepID=D8TRK7_VOLCA|nr:uncharacterized protein VOLCADRAFT_89395 [Volvox carteri f. nagariensis]EFJ50011.1 hypothetical protein VOLCADRAFT_89395 [Volvox carteri f. nagariensis]|eukprot:XP_002949076.1 hypothetical protein VOLCADRAFT_89395 [Volvox carteri f. nagariensis]